MDNLKAKGRRVAKDNFCVEQGDACEKCEFYAKDNDCSVEFGYKLGIGTAVNYLMGKVNEIDLSKVDNPNAVMMDLIASARDIYKE